MAKLKQNQDEPPRNDELELSLFGPGKGECIAIHLGNGNWMVVDSCISASDNKPIALSYFERLKVDVPRQVKLVVVSHWHDDHIRGISQVVREANSALFACSAALRYEEFCTLVKQQQEMKLVEQTSGMAEFADVLEILDQRSGSRFASGPDLWAAEGTLLHRNNEPNGIEVLALSPSSQTITDATGELARLIPTVGDQIRRFPRPMPNKLSVVLMVKSVNVHFLLGGDLEVGADQRRGWRAVIESPIRPSVTSSAYKIAHHGSPNADHQEIWSRLLVQNPFAVVAPYAGGKTPLPSPNDVERVKSRTNRLHCTIPPQGFRPERRSGVDGTMRRVARWRRAVRNKPGHIRLRVPVAGTLEDISVALFDGAVRL